MYCFYSSSALPEEEYVVHYLYCILLCSSALFILYIVMHCLLALWL